MATKRSPASPRPSPSPAPYHPTLTELGLLAAELDRENAAADEALLAFPKAPVSEDYRGPWFKERSRYERIMDRTHRSRMAVREIMTFLPPDADSDDVAQAFRNDLAQHSDLMSPGVPG